MEIPGLGYWPTSRLIAVGVLVVLAIVVLPRLFRRAPSSKHLIPARCGKCGWTGSVSRYKPRCPSCASDIRL